MTKPTPSDNQKTLSLDKTSIIEQLAETKARLEQFLGEKKTIGTLEDFKGIEDKEGATAGLYAVSIKDQHPHVIKLTHSEDEHRSKFPTEFYMSALYERWLPGQASTVELLVEKDKIQQASTVNGKTLPVVVIEAKEEGHFQKSKFFSDFTPLHYLFEPLELGGETTMHFPKLSNAQGIEKVLAAEIVGGENDPRQENKGQVGDKIVKIDHGESSGRHTSPQSLMQNFHSTTTFYSYDSLNPELPKLINHLTQMSAIPIEEVEKLLAAQDYKLQQIGFLPKALDRDEPRSSECIIQTETIKQNIAVAKDTIPILEAITKIDFISEEKKTEFLKKGWVDTLETGDPIKWVASLSPEDCEKWGIKPQKTIEGKTPEDYATIYQLVIPDQHSSGYESYPRSNISSPGNWRSKLTADELKYGFEGSDSEDSRSPSPSAFSIASKSGGPVNNGRDSATSFKSIDSSGVSSYSSLPATPVRRPAPRAGRKQSLGHD